MTTEQETAQAALTEARRQARSAHEARNVAWTKYFIACTELSGARARVLEAERQVFRADGGEDTDSESADRISRNV